MGKNHDIDGSINCSFNNYFGWLEKWNLKLIQSLREGDKQVLSCRIPFALPHCALELSLSKDRQMLSDELSSLNRRFSVGLSHTRPLSRESTSVGLALSTGLLEFDPFRRDHFFDHLAPQNCLSLEALKTLDWSHDLRDSALTLKARLDGFVHDWSLNARLQAQWTDAVYLDSRLGFSDLLRNKIESTRRW